MAKNTADSGGIGKALKKYLITGILVWLPIAVTLWVITYIVSASDQLINLLPEHWQQPPRSWRRRRYDWQRQRRHRRLS